MTTTPLTGWPVVPVSLTTRGAAKGELSAADCPLPETRESCAGVAGWAAPPLVRVKDAMGSPGADAVTTYVPGVAFAVSIGLVAMPLELVVPKATVKAPGKLAPEPVGGP